MLDMWNEKSKNCFINEIVDIAVFVTQIPLSIFTNLFHQKFEKHSMFESTLEMLQQFNIQIETESAIGRWAYQVKEEEQINVVLFVTKN
jgi:hypothetical protein